MNFSTIDFIIPNQILTSIIADVFLFVFLVFFSHAPAKVKEEKRFPFACLSSIFFWIFLLYLFPSPSSVVCDSFIYLVSGFCIILGGIIICWTFWTQIAWGFRLTMLINLASQSNPIDLESWMDEYGGGQGRNALLNSRLEMLIRLGWAYRESDMISLDPKSGMLAGKLVSIFRKIFALDLNL